MLISIITLFPEMFQSVFEHSISKRAKIEKRIEIQLVNLRDFGIGKHKTVDDTPYGGGTGMVLKVDVLDNAIQSVMGQYKKELVVLLDPKGIPYTQSKAEYLSNQEHVILLCGRYEGVDARIEKLIDESISIGDFVLSGGEIPAMAVCDSIIRLIPGVLKKDDATILESFSNIEGRRHLEAPVYTKPNMYKGFQVPEVLRSGNKKMVDEYNNKEALRLTKKRRPDLLKSTKS